MYRLCASTRQIQALAVAPQGDTRHKIHSTAEDHCDDGFVEPQVVLKRAVHTR